MALWAWFNWRIQVKGRKSIFLGTSAAMISDILKIVFLNRNLFLSIDFLVFFF